METRTSPNWAYVWNDTVGVVYRQEELERQLQDVSIEIPIVLHDEVGGPIYPSAQFGRSHEGWLEPYPHTAELWQGQLAPAIERGVINEQTAAAFLFQNHYPMLFGNQTIAEVLRATKSVSEETVRFISEFTISNIELWSRGSNSI